MVDHDRQLSVLSGDTLATPLPNKTDSLKPPAATNTPTKTESLKPPTDAKVKSDGLKTPQSQLSRTSSPVSVPAPAPPAVEDHGFTFMLGNIISQLQLSGIICTAVFLPMITSWLFGKVGVAFGVLVVIGLSYVWQREMAKYKTVVRTEIQRLNGLKLLETDSETAEWLNHILSRFWLIFEPIISDIVVSSVNSILEYYQPGFLDSLGLIEFTLGTNAPRITSFRAYESTDNDTIRFDVDAVFQPKDPEDLSLRKGERNSRIVLNARVGRGVVGVDVPVLVKEVGFSGTISVQIKTMNGFPYAKTVSVSFPKHPEIEFVLKPLKGMDLMDMPGLNNFLHKLIADVLGWLFVAPNAFLLDLDAIMNGASVNVESAVGVLMIRIYEARDLKNVETLRQSDPYTLVKIGGREVARTRVINNNLNPYWNETFYVMINSLNDELEFHVLDEDLIKDRPLGNMKMPLSSFEFDKTSKHEDIWKALKVSKEAAAKEKTKGELRFEVHYYPIPAEPAKVESKSGILRVIIHQAKELDESKSMVGEYNPFVEVLHNGISIHKTKTKKRTNNPQWEDINQVFIRDSSSDKLKFIVRDQRDLAADPEVGDCEVVVREVVQALRNPALPKIEWWTLRNAASGKLRISFAYTPIEFDHSVPQFTASKKVILPPAIGVLRVKVVEACDLKNFEAVGKSDPYCNVVFAGETRARTESIDDTLDPLWNETFYVLVQDTSLKGKVSFDVFDFNQNTKDKFMGAAIFDTKVLLEAGKNPADVSDLWLPVLYEGKTCGQIHVEIGYHAIRPKDIKKEVEVPAANPDGTVGTKLIVDRHPTSPVELYNSGIVRVEIHEAELFENSLIPDGYSQKKKPSPYLEFVDISLSMCSNEVESFKDRKKQGGVNPPRSRRPTSELQVLDEPISAGDLVTLYRTTAQSKTYNPTFNETSEIFIKDIENARMLILVKDHDSKKNNNGDEVKVERDLKNPIIGKIDLSLRTLIHAAYVRSQSVNNISAEQSGPEVTNMPVEWYKLFSSNPKVQGSIGRMRLSVSFSAVQLDEDILTAEQDLEATDSGKLHMELVDARSLPAVDSSGTSDPYCNFKLNNEKVFKSKVEKKNNMHPKWNESFDVIVKRRATSRMLVECRDWNQFEDNELLGYVMFDLSKITIEEKVDEIYELYDDNGDVIVGPNGEKSSIHIKYLFTPDDLLSGKKGKKRPRSKKNVFASGVGAVGGAAFNVAGAVGGAAKKFLRIKKEKSNNALNQPSGEANATTGGAAHTNGEHKEGTPPTSQHTDTLAAEASKSKSSLADKHSSNEDNGKGTVVVSIIRAEKLKLIDGSTLPDPYVKVRLVGNAIADNKSASSMLGGKKESILHKTKALKKVTDPTWNESFPIPLEYDSASEASYVLNFSVKDHNLIGSGVELGEYEVDVRELFRMQLRDYSKSFKVDVTSRSGELRGGGDGILHLALEFHPFGSLEVASKSGRTLSGASLAESVGSHGEKKEKHMSIFGRKK